MRVLLIAHGYPPSAQAGTELYTQSLARALAASGDTVRVLAREADPSLPERNLRVEAREDHEVVLVNNTFRDADGFADAWKATRLCAAVLPFVDDFSPEVAHVQHLTCLSTDLIAALDARQIPIVFTLQDFWLLCQRGQLLDRELKACSGPSPEKCARCLGASSWAPPSLRRVPLPASLREVAAAAASRLAPEGAGAAALEQRLREVRGLCERVDRFLCPSETVRALFLAAGVPAAKLSRTDPGIDHAPFAGLTRTDSPALRIGFAGTLMASKAPHLLLQAFALLPPGRASLHLFGNIAAYHGDDSYRQVLAPLLEQPGVHHHGPVAHADLPRALAAIDVLVMPSIWLENAPFILREAALAGVPAVASDQGGMRESVRHEVDGLLFPVGDARALARSLQRLIDEPELLPRLRRGLRRPASLQEDAARVRAVYREVIDARRSRSAAQLAAVVLNFRTLSRTLSCLDSLQSGTLRPQRTWVVDNDSQDGSGAFLRERLGRAAVICTERNRGFSGGINAGIEAALAAGAQQLLLLNGDLTLAPDTVARLSAALASEPSLGAVAPVVLNRRDPTVVETDGIRFDPRTGRMRHHGFGSRRDPARSGVREVDAVSGACMLLSRRLLETVGLFDQAYFFTFEDLDLCLRARAAGFRVACVDHAVAFHEGGASLAPGSPQRSYFAARNHLMLAREHAPGSGLARLARSAAILALNAGDVLLHGASPRTQGLAAVARGAFDYLRGRSGDGR